MAAMVRRSEKINPGDGPVAAFAQALRELRETAGNTTFRAMS